MKYPLLQYFEICMMIYPVMTTVFYDIHGILKVKLSEKDEMLLRALERDFEILKNQYSIRSTDNFDLYYRIHGRLQ